MSFFDVVDSEEVNRTLLEQIDLELELNLLIAHSTQARLNYALLLYTFIRDNEADPDNFWWFIYEFSNQFY